MKTLNLILKKKWYDLIKQGIKLEEYRELNQYYRKRIINGCKGCKDDNCDDCGNNRLLLRLRRIISIDKVQLRNGYTKKTMLFYVKEIVIDKGKPEWGAEPDKLYFVIKLGKRII